MATFDLDADRHLLALCRELNTDRYQPNPWHFKVVYDPKIRLIAVPSIRDRVLHRALLDEIGPHYERSYIEHSYTGGLGRGPHLAVLGYQRWLRRYGYRLHLDIRRYFPSILHPTLCTLLFRKLRDSRTRTLIERLLQHGGEVYHTPLARKVLELEHDTLEADRGMPLGSYFSQWCGTFYLDGLDHFVKRSLKINGYLRYMDDFVLFSDTKADLLSARDHIAEWLDNERRLRLNPKHTHVIPNHVSSVFLGYRVSRAGTSPSRKLRRRLRQQVRLAAKRSKAHLVRSLHAYRGLLLF